MEIIYLQSWKWEKSHKVLKMEECLEQLVGAIGETMESSFYIAHITLSLYHGSGQCTLKPITMSSWIKFSDEMESKLDILILICFYKHCIQLGDIKMKQSIGMCYIWKEAEAIHVCRFQLCISLVHLVLVCIFQTMCITQFYNVYKPENLVSFFNLRQQC